MLKKVKIHTIRGLNDGIARRVKPLDLHEAESLYPNLLPCWANKEAKSLRGYTVVLYPGGHPQLVDSRRIETREV